MNLILFYSQRIFFILTHATVFFLFTRIKKQVSLNIVMMTVYFYPPQVKQQRNKRQAPKQLPIMKVDEHNTLVLIA